MLGDQLRLKLDVKQAAQLGRGAAAEPSSTPQGRSTRVVSCASRSRATPMGHPSNTRAAVQATSDPAAACGWGAQPAAGVPSTFGCWVASGIDESFHNPSFTRRRRRGLTTRA